jgi:hypothetical protein
MRTRKTKATARTKSVNTTRAANTPKPPRQAIRILNSGDPDPAYATINNSEEVYFHNNHRTLKASIKFSGDRALFKADGSHADSQEVKPSKDGEILTGKAKDRDQLVYYEVEMKGNRGRKGNRSRIKGNGTIKIGQTL